MTDRLREAAQALHDSARWINDEQAIVSDSEMVNLRAALAEPEHAPDCALLQIPSRDCDCDGRAEPPVKESLTTHPSIIDSIADHLVADHVALMNENRQLRESLREILYEIYPPEHYTDETVEYEMGQGNMMMPAVQRAYALVGRDSHE